MKNKHGKKRYDIRTINFGEVGNPTRIVVEQFVSKNGHAALSEIIRKITFCYLSGLPQHASWRKEFLFFERREFAKEILLNIAGRKDVEKELLKIGIPEEEWEILGQ